MNMQRLNLTTTIVIVLTVLSTGCAVKKKPPSQSDFAYANYGSPKSIQDFELNVRQGLKDPYSAQISCSQPKKGWFEIKAQSFPNQYGYVSVCQVNAKNSFGAYIGEQSHIYCFTGDDFLPIDDILVTQELFEFHPVP